MLKFQKVLGTAFLLLLVFMYSCKKDENHETNNTINIGALIPLTGTGSSSGEGFNAAIAIAKQDINNYLKSIHSPYSLVVTTKDTETDTLVSVRMYNELRDKGIRFIVGPYSSANVKALTPYADKDGLLLVSPSSVAISLAVAGDNIFRLVPNDLGQAEAVTALLNDDSIEVIVPIVRDDLWGNELLAATTQQFLNTRKEVIDAVKYSPSTTDFGELVVNLSDKVQNALMAHQPDKVAVYMISFGEGTAILNAASLENSLNAVRWYGASAFAENNSLVENMDAGLFAFSRELACPIFGYDPNAKAKWEPLLNELQAELGRKPDIYSLVIYDALWLATLTYLSTGENPEISQLKEAFVSQANNYYGATGWTGLNEAGDRAQATYDFWGVHWFVNAPVWEIVATYNNATKELTRY